MITVRKKSLFLRHMEVSQWKKTVIKVDPFVSVNGIKFGTAREKVHEILGKPEDSFFKGDDDIETDVYSCFHTCYDSEYKF
ncbi:hypothetical protein [Ruminococcus albus]|uniref:Uncharacterized protein n=1 Tax=Ruminococcus albus 8 TaxID=246199 RepID=E9S8W2_RUMAL|nr:hypothetical protein [Ruminococcus albus]EGC04307.1 hypothetical protein CUS_5607 [Ruminococcus albus 8]